MLESNENFAQKSESESSLNVPSKKLNAENDIANIFNKPGSKSAKISENDKLNKTFKCKYCNKDYHSYASRYNHMKIKQLRIR